MSQLNYTIMLDIVVSTFVHFFKRNNYSKIYCIVTFIDSILFLWYIKTELLLKLKLYINTHI